MPRIPVVCETCGALAGTIAFPARAALSAMLAGSPFAMIANYVPEPIPPEVIALVAPLLAGRCTLHPEQESPNGDTQATGEAGRAKDGGEQDDEHEHDHEHEEADEEGGTRRVDRRGFLGRGRGRRQS